MIHWTAYKENKPLKLVTTRLSKIIIKELGSLEGFFDFTDKIRPQRTRLIKDTLSLLAEKKMKGKPVYKSYAHGLSEKLRQGKGGTFKNAEWLYDLHWYTEGADPYTTTSLPLVMECEWNPRRKGDTATPYSGIKYDFQKLIVSNASLRLMIFKIEKLSSLEELGTYFENNIANYKPLPKGSSFLFIAFHHSLRTFHYAEIIK